ncbi:MAG: Ig-like domain-containing protein [Aureibaculum sp.]
MFKHFSSIIILLLITLLITDCARKGRPEGGPKDEASPIMVSAKPPHLTTNFDEKEIRIYFDEYIKLKDLYNQLIVSPPLKFQPIIKPLGTPSKYISIKILDTLKENTTYTFNFGQSVIDNTEGNILRSFKYVFSTGDVIDSLKISGSVKDAFQKEPGKNISVMLYEINKEYTDSIIYNEKPYYLGNTLDTAVWEITNIKAGHYLLIGLKDVAKNYKFDPKVDKIGFIDDKIFVPNDSTHILNLFKEELPFKLVRPSEIKKGHIQLGFEGKPDSLKIIALDESENFKYYSILEKDKDTLNYWFKENSKDSLQLVVLNRDYKDTVVVKLRNKEIDSLELKSSTRSILHLRDKFMITSNIPIQSIDTSKVSLTTSDSISVAHTFTLMKDKTELELDFNKEFSKRYALQLLPEAIIDFYGNVNDTLKFQMNIKKPADYGNLYLTLQNIKRYPVIVQLITLKGDLVEEKYAENEQEYIFLNLVPAKYLIRVIFDDNKNKKWDTGNYLLKRQPEEVEYIETVLDIRANWEMTETFILK